VDYIGTIERHALMAYDKAGRMLNDSPSDNDRAHTVFDNGSAGIVWLRRVRNGVRFGRSGIARTIPLRALNEETVTDAFRYLFSIAPYNC
jgi:hypothetical protein